jgi:glycerol kinase
LSERFVVAVDQSTSATKAFLFGPDGRPASSVGLPHAQSYPRPGWVEHDPMAILANTRSAIEGLVRDSGVAKDALAALGITNQRETIVAWDEKSGEPVYRALVWQDERGAPYCDRVKASGSSSELRRKTGLVADTNFSAGKLAWLVDNVDAARSALRAGRLMCGTIDAWLVWNLTGRKVFATDWSNASRTLLFDIGKLAWDEGLIELFGLKGIRLPEARSSDSGFGIARFDGFSLPIASVMGDSHAALYGQGGFEAGSAKATYGTGSSVMLNSGYDPPTPPEGIVASVGFGRKGRANYVLEGNIRSSGDTLRWVGEELGLFSSLQEAETMAAALLDSGGVYLVPAFSGLGAPHWKSGTRAVICGLARSSGRAQIIRAAFESIAYQVVDVAAAMAAGAQSGVRELRVDGAPTSNAFLMQFQADILGASLRVASIPDVSARGAAFMAGLSAGLWKDEAELALLASPAAEYSPKMGDREREALLGGWDAALERTLLGIER